MYNITIQCIKFSLWSIISLGLLLYFLTLLTKKPKSREVWRFVWVKLNWKLLGQRQKPKALEAKVLVYSPLSPTSASQVVATQPHCLPVGTTGSSLVIIIIISINNDHLHYLLCASCVPGQVLSTFHKLSHLILKNSEWSRYDYYLHFRNENWIRRLRTRPSHRVKNPPSSI